MHVISLITDWYQVIYVRCRQGDFQVQERTNKKQRNRRFGRLTDAWSQSTTFDKWIAHGFEQQPFNFRGEGFYVIDPVVLRYYSRVPLGECERVCVCLCVCPCVRSCACGWEGVCVVVMETQYSAAAFVSTQYDFILFIYSSSIDTSNKKPSHTHTHRRIWLNA